jgi:hypothetical protein
MAVRKKRFPDDRNHAAINAGAVSQLYSFVSFAIEAARADVSLPFGNRT